MELNSQPMDMDTITSKAKMPASAPVSAGPADSVSVKMMNKITSSSSGSAIVLLIVGIAAAFVTAYILYWIITKSIVGQQSYLVPETSVPILATSENKYTASTIPASLNGHRSSLCFWIYIYDINKFMGSYRHVLHRGDETDDVTTASPYIYIDANTNAMHISFATNRVTNTFGPETIGSAYLSTDAAKTARNCYNDTSAGSVPVSSDAIAKYIQSVRGTTIDYVPLQRWVHIGIVVNEELNGGTITTYVDGEMAKTVSSNSAYTGAPITSIPTNNPSVSYNVIGTGLKPTLNIIDVNLDRAGSIYTGGSIGSQVGPGFSGMLSKIQFFNYDMNAADIYNNYLKGPVDSVLVNFGLPAYGLRSPIYRMA